MGEDAREDGDFSRRTTWSGNKHGYTTAAAVTAAPSTLDFVLPVAGGVSGTVTSEAGGRPDGAGVTSLRRRQDASATPEVLGRRHLRRALALGRHLHRAVLGTDHVTEWWKNATPDKAVTITVKPGQMVTGISAALSKEVKAVERPEVKGGAWVGKTVRLDEGAWNTENTSRFTYEWLVGTTVVATGPSLKVTKSMLGKKLTGRVTNDAGFAQGQAITKATPKVGYQPKVKAKVSARSAAITLKVKPLKAKKVKATITVFEIVGVKKNGDDKLQEARQGQDHEGQGRRPLQEVARQGQAQARLLREGQGQGRLWRHQEGQAQALIDALDRTTAPAGDSPRGPSAREHPRGPSALSGA